jgi:hypothetical protein
MFSPPRMITRVRRPLIVTYPLRSCRDRSPERSGSPVPRPRPGNARDWLRSRYGNDGVSWADRPDRLGAAP